ncbi:hypothetical protein [Clostridioides difficile]|uniref:hypothetical protein n=1 Tax=Clostridioides difficile TaxID=1496 RepID=UPI00355619F5
MYNSKAPIGISTISIICDNFDEESATFALSNSIAEDNSSISDIFILSRFTGFDGLLFLTLLAKRTIGFVNNLDAI